MTVNIAEKVDSRELIRGKRSSLLTRWIVYEDDPDTEITEVIASDALIVGTPATWLALGYPRSSVQVTPVGDPLDSQIWEGEVIYEAGGNGGSSNPASSGEAFFNFDTGVSTQHITQSDETYDKLGTAESSPGAGDGRTATNWNRAINASKEEVAGVDRLVPDFRFSETHYFDYDFVTSDYVLTLKSMSMTINNADFRDFSAGEVLFLNAVGNRRGTAADDGWEISFNFAVKDNYPIGFTPAPGLEALTTARTGWAYLWVGYKQQEETVSSVNRLKLTPQEAYLEEIYQPADFANLGIGTGSLLPTPTPTI